MQDVDLLQLNITLYHFFLFLPTPPSYICQEHESNTTLRSSFGVHIVFHRACGSNQALRKFKKRVGWGGAISWVWPSGRYHLQPCPSAYFAKEFHAFLSSPPTHSSCHEVFAGRPFLHFSHVAIRRARHERSASGTNLTPQSRERGGEGEGGKPAADPLFFFFFFLFPCPLEGAGMDLSPANLITVFLNTRLKRSVHI